MLVHFYGDSWEKNPVEANAYMADTVQTEHGGYAVAAMASAQGPYRLPSAAVNTVMKGISEALSDGSLFTGQTDAWKMYVNQLLRSVHMSCRAAASSLSVQLTVSACVMLILPDATLSILSCGNVPSLIRQGDRILYGNSIEQNVQSLLTKAIGVNQSGQIKATKTTLTEDTAILFLSPGFVKFLQPVAEKIKSSTDIKLLPMELVSYIKQQRGLACTDAVLELVCKGGDETEKRNGEGSDAGLTA